MLASTNKSRRLNRSDQVPAHSEIKICGKEVAKVVNIIQVPEEDFSAIYHRIAKNTAEEPKRKKF
ncbi:hypothetical protein NBRC111893_2120 [Lentilactobacillus kosonis]|uniref:Uncharacterized protein n=1 Tax=Lentilactobacillus kosonis TaxID=2810561 RepID=A0A401FNN8_9LACO|nr:hypothetical protein NBRC111893_2120 [Lentilactobacillus kosonis]